MAAATVDRLLARHPRPGDRQGGPHDAPSASLPERFEQAIDMAAMRAEPPARTTISATGAGPTRSPCGDDLEAEAEAAAAPGGRVRPGGARSASSPIRAAPRRG